MKLAKEPKEVDLIIKSEPWTEKDLADFRALMQKIKSKNKRKRTSAAANSANQTNSKQTRNHLP
jgi:hypothetical protein